MASSMKLKKNNKGKPSPNKKKNPQNPSAKASQKQPDIYTYDALSLEDPSSKKDNHQVYYSQGPGQSSSVANQTLIASNNQHQLNSNPYLSNPMNDSNNRATPSVPSSSLLKAPPPPPPAAAGYSSSPMADAQMARNLSLRSSPTFYFNQSNAPSSKSWITENHVAFNAPPAHYFNHSTFDHENKESENESGINLKTGPLSPGLGASGIKRSGLFNFSSLNKVCFDDGGQQSNKEDRLKSLSQSHYEYKLKNSDGSLRSFNPDTLPIALKYKGHRPLVSNKQEVKLHSLDDDFTLPKNRISTHHADFIKFDLSDSAKEKLQRREKMLRLAASTPDLLAQRLGNGSSFSSFGEGSTYSQDFQVDRKEMKKANSVAILRPANPWLEVNEQRDRTTSISHSAFQNPSSLGYKYNLANGNDISKNYYQLKNKSYVNANLVDPQYSDYYPIPSHQLHPNQTSITTSGGGGGGEGSASSSQQQGLGQGQGQEQGLQGQTSVNENNKMSHNPLGANHHIPFTSTSLSRSTYLPPNLSSESGLRYKPLPRSLQNMSHLYTSLTMQPDEALRHPVTGKYITQKGTINRIIEDQENGLSRNAVLNGYSKNFPELEKQTKLVEKLTAEKNIATEKLNNFQMK